MMACQTSVGGLSRRPNRHASRVHSAPRTAAGRHTRTEQPHSVPRIGFLTFALLPAPATTMLSVHYPDSYICLTILAQPPYMSKQTWQSPFRSTKKVFSSPAHSREYATQSTQCEIRAIRALPMAEAAHEPFAFSAIDEAIPSTPKLVVVQPLAFEGTTAPSSCSVITF